MLGCGVIVRFGLFLSCDCGVDIASWVGVLQHVVWDVVDEYACVNVDIPLQEVFHFISKTVQIAVSCSPSRHFLIYSVFLRLINGIFGYIW